MAAPEWNSKHTALKPFTYPVPETRFFHAGGNVFKFKIKYGNTIGVNIDLHANVMDEELEEAIRVILGNLDNLHPFATEHLVLFPYISKWERVSDLRFKCHNGFLIPYPYVCTVYVELNSWKQNIFLDNAEYRSASNSVSSQSKLSESMDLERAMKWRRLGGVAEMSQAQLYMNRNVTKNNASYIYDTAKPNVGFGSMSLQKEIIYQTQNQSEGIRHQCYGPPLVNSGCDKMSLCKKEIITVNGVIL